MLRGVAYPDRAVSPEPLHLRGALCVADTRFTSGQMSNITRAQLLAVCHRCPVLAACREDRDRWRTANPLDWQQFYGVWAGQAFTRGQTSTGTGNRR